MSPRLFTWGRAWWVWGRRACCSISRCRIRRAVRIGKGLKDLSQNRRTDSSLNMKYLSLLLSFTLVAQVPEPKGAGLEPGTFPVKWITGGPDCSQVPKWQVH